jgi:hypothetical protein
MEVSLWNGVQIGFQAMVGVMLSLQEMVHALGRQQRQCFPDVPLKHIEG